METSVATFGNNMREAIQSLGDFFLVKMTISWATMAGFYMVGMHNMPLLGMLTTLVAIDLATGVWSAYKTGEAIESRKMVKSAVKWTLYMLMVSAAHLTEKLIPVDFFLASVTIAYLGATELISILENVGRSGVAIPLRLLNKLEEFRRNQ